MHLILGVVAITIDLDDEAQTPVVEEPRPALHVEEVLVPTSETATVKKQQKMVEPVVEDSAEESLALDLKDGQFMR